MKIHHLMIVGAIAVSGAVGIAPEFAFNQRQTAANVAHAAPSADLAIYTEGGIAIDGTDPVAYFTANAPVPGSADITYEWGGATWRFSSEANRDLFVENPEAYAPQYGGYCAWAVAQGYSAPTDPNAWRIVDGKLYLNFNRNIQGRWERDIPGNIAKGNTNWPEVSQSL